MNQSSYIKSPSIANDIRLCGNSHLKKNLDTTKPHYRTYFASPLVYRFFEVKGSTVLRFELANEIVLTQVQL